MESRKVKWLVRRYEFYDFCTAFQTLAMSLKPEETRHLLTYLGPLINRAEFFRIHFYDDQTEIIHVLSKFVAKGSVEYLRVHELRSESSHL